MKKKFIKSTLAVAILTVAGLGGMKEYENYEAKKGDLLKLNIEALSQNEGSYREQVVCYKSLEWGIMDYIYKCPENDSDPIKYCSPTQVYARKSNVGACDIIYVIR